MLFTLHGCGFTDVPDVDIEEAILYSPEGEFEFIQDKKHPSLFYSSDGGIKISLFPIRGKTSFVSYYNKNIFIKENEAYYQLNNSKKGKLLVKKSR